MNTFGLTPVDTALSVAGLNLSQVLMSFIFRKSGIGVVFGLGAYLLLLWRFSRTGHYSLIWVYAVLLIVLILLLFPSQELNSFTSFQESQENSNHISKTLKDSFIKSDRVPVIFTFISHSVDQIIYALINVMDKLMSTQAKFLPQAHQLQVQALYIREAVQVGFSDLKLQARFNAFVLEQYAPTLTQYIHDHPNVSANKLGPGQDDIMAYYPQHAKDQWNGPSGISALCDQYFLKDEYLKPSARARFLPFLESHKDFDLKQSILSSFTQHVIIKDSLKHRDHRYILLTNALKVFPYVHGAAQIVLAVIFPIIILSIIVSGKYVIFIHYLKNFFWIKSWALCAAISFYLSVFIAHAQANAVQSQEIAWAWEHPLFVDGYMVFLLLFIILSRMVIVKGG